MDRRSEIRSETNCARLEIDEIAIKSLSRFDIRCINIQIAIYAISKREERVIERSINLRVKIVCPWLDSVNLRLLDFDAR